LFEPIVFGFCAVNFFSTYPNDQQQKPITDIGFCQQRKSETFSILSFSLATPPIQDVVLMVKELNATLSGTGFCIDGCSSNNQTYYVKLHPAFYMDAITLQFRSG
jgi:hypothetical protein